MMLSMQVIQFYRFCIYEWRHSKSEALNHCSVPFVEKKNKSSSTRYRVDGRMDGRIEWVKEGPAEGPAAKRDESKVHEGLYKK